MYCADCEKISEYFFEKTRFWMWCPTLETFGKLAAWCGNQSFEAQQNGSHCIAVDVPAQKTSEFLIGLAGTLEAAELAGTKVTTTEGAEPGLEAFGRVVTAETLVNRYQTEWIVEAINKQQYTSWFQPIVHANRVENPEIFAHEALFRISDDQGNIVPPSLVFKQAERADLLFSLDLVARRSAVVHAARAGLTSKVFINFNPSSIYDPSYCLRATASAIAELGLKPENIVFEITETHRVENLAHLKGILTFYRNAGFGVALDDIGSGWSGLNLLSELRPDYVKLDMELVRNVHRSSLKQSIVKHLIEIARENYIRVIGEGVETIEEANWLIEHRCDYIQGYLYGRPEPKSSATEHADLEQMKISAQGLQKAAMT